MATVDAGGLRAVAAQLRALAASLQAESDAAIGTALEETIRRLVGVTPEQTRSDPRHPGHMRDAYHAAMLGPGTWELLNEAPYSAYVIQGSPAHHISPRTKSILAWPDDAGEYIFAHGVEHPGNIGNEPLNEIVDETEAFLEETLGVTVERLAGRLLA